MKLNGVARGRKAELVKNLRNYVTIPGGMVYLSKFLQIT
nr:MAG TPA: hypothetical protein [Caudoviricetes sp.]